MAGVAGEHGAATGLGHVAHQQAVPAIALLGFLGQFFHQLDKCRVGPIAVARGAHGLPGRAGHGQRLAAREAALGIAANGAGLQIHRQLLGAKQFLGGRVLEVSGGQRGEGRLVLGCLGLGKRCRDEQDCSEESCKGH